ncbi:Putative Acyl-CoA dehydrogenase [[Torrubiella] hemipterigena]|uniref:Putative Acyl-CoA dehydrogenase n=1 Tax=[Torrubiella] hemipterigena TaxID=1531966 RepID=A0A0A1TNI8_9HYPO|nr:Putative Acyl-CoA dehydrogenase [[Torrubiella] hemipterigena]
MPPDPKLNLDERIPWSEPAWYTSLNSPYYNESHRKLRNRVRAYIDTNVLPYAMEWEEKGEVPKAEAIKYLQSGFALEDIPAQFKPANLPSLVEGQAPDAFHMLILIDETSRIEGGVNIGLAGANSIGIPPIVNYGTPEQQAKWLPGLFTFDTSFCLGITEPTGGSDVANLRTTAVRSKDGKSFVVNGVKKWITGSPWATHMTTAVRTGEDGRKGISVLVIPLDSPGITITKIHNSGQNAGGASFVDLENVTVPAANLIGQENQGFNIIMRNFNRERFLLAVQCNRKTRSCLAASFSYALTRETFGKALMHNQAIRSKLTEMAHRVEAHWAWLEQIAYHVGTSPEGWNSPDIASRIALLKVQGGQMVELAAREAQQIFGGAGYQKSGPGATVEQISRDLRMLVVGGGSEEIMSDLAIRQELMMAQKAAKL